MSRLRAIVRGQVQGVGFRMWAQRRARMLGISGYVRNLADGSVEVVGEGPRETLEQFLAVLASWTGKRRRTIRPGKLGDVRQ